MKYIFSRVAAAVTVFLSLHDFTEAQEQASEPEQSLSMSNDNDLLRVPIKGEAIDCRELQKLASQSQSSVLLKSLLSLYDQKQCVSIPVDALELVAALSGSPLTIERDAGGHATCLVVSRSDAIKHSDSWKNALFSMIGSQGSLQECKIVPVAHAWSPEILGRFTTPVEDKVSTPIQVTLVIAGYRSQFNDAVVFAQQLHATTSEATCVFYYPTSVQIEQTGNALRECLLKLQRQFPAAEVRIVAHSMGGLVARTALETKEGANVRCVKQLVQIFPPNQGSVLAELTEPGDALQLSVLAMNGLQKAGWTTDDSTNPMSAAFGIMLDGFGGASRDLRPGSSMIVKLNALPRRGDIRYVVIAGNHGPISPLLGALNNELLRLIDKPDMQALQKLSPVLQRYGTAAELQRGQGDGAVAVNSTYLAGVNEHHVIDSNHFQWAVDEQVRSKIFSLLP